MSTDQQDQQPTSEEARTNVLLEVSNAIVRLLKEQFGRGPTTARSFWVGQDALTCYLEDTLTPAERRLVAMGEHQRLRDTRMFLQYASIEELCAPVERLTGRKVRSFHSSIDTLVDGLTVETFIFYPQGQDGPSRIELAKRERGLA